MEDVFSLKIRNYQKVLHNYDSSTYAIGLEYHDFPSEIMKLFTCGGKYCSTVAERSEACMLHYFPPNVNNVIIALAKS